MSRGATGTENEGGATGTEIERYTQTELLEGMRWRLENGRAGVCGPFSSGQGRSCTCGAAVAQFRRMNLNVSVRRPRRPSMSRDRIESRMRNGPVMVSSQDESSLDTRCGVAACAAILTADAERRRQSRLLTPHC
eukprot:6326764-Prymnesium_polylepis.2